MMGRVLSGRHRGFPGNEGLSSGLVRFVEELPLERRSILEFIQREARRLEPGTRVLDAGAGAAPYREFFSHCEYTTLDWPQSLHTGSAKPDITASLEDLSAVPRNYDVVLSTQVLEHVADPKRVLSQLRHVLRRGGKLLLTVPLVWWLHEQPHDYYRFTSHGLRYLLNQAGFIEAYIRPRNGYFTTMAMLGSAATLAIADSSQPPIAARLQAALVRVVTSRATWLDRYDSRRTLPLGYEVVATVTDIPG